MNVLKTSTTQMFCEHLHGSHLLPPVFTMRTVTPVAGTRKWAQGGSHFLRSHSWEEGEGRFGARGWGWGGRAGEGHPFRLSFPVIHTPGVGGELSISTGEGAGGRCSPGGKVPHREGSGAAVEGLVLT